MTAETWTSWLWILQRNHWLLSNLKDLLRVMSVPSVTILLFALLKSSMHMWWIKCDA
jgi:hypothetical protein